MRCILILLIFCAGCSRQPSNPVKDARQEANDLLVPIAELRKSAEEGKAAAQRELAGRLLLGHGVQADPAEAVDWARKARKCRKALRTRPCPRPCRSRWSAHQHKSGWLHLLAETGRKPPAREEGPDGREQSREVAQDNQCSGFRFGFSTRTHRPQVRRSKAQPRRGEPAQRGQSAIQKPPKLALA